MSNPLPKSYDDWDWYNTYFNVGDEITWKDYDFAGGAIHTGIVTAIKRNQYRRISYRVGKEEILMEQVRMATGQKPLKRLVKCPHCMGTGKVRL